MNLGFSVSYEKFYELQKINADSIASEFIEQTVGPKTIKRFLMSLFTRALEWPFSASVLQGEVGTANELCLCAI